MTPWTAACQASLAITNSQSLLILMSMQLVMPSNHLILCFPLSSCPKSFPASGSFPRSQFFISGGQSIGVSASVSVLPMLILLFKKKCGVKIKWCFPGCSDYKESSCNSGELGLIRDLGRSTGEGNGYSLQYACLRIPWTEEPSRLNSMGLQRVRHDWVTNTLGCAWILKLNLLKSRPCVKDLRRQISLDRWYWECQCGNGRVEQGRKIGQNWCINE